MNQWIRTKAQFDAIIDFDKVVQDSNNSDLMYPPSTAAMGFIPATQLQKWEVVRLDLFKSNGRRRPATKFSRSRNIADVFTPVPSPRWVFSLSDKRKFIFVRAMAIVELFRVMKRRTIFCRPSRLDPEAVVFLGKLEPNPIQSVRVAISRKLEVVKAAIMIQEELGSLSLKCLRHALWRFQACLSMTTRIDRDRQKVLCRLAWTGSVDGG